MDSADLGTPVTSSDWDDVALGIHQGSLDGDLDFLGALNSDTDVTLSVTASNDGLESGSLTGLGLLLDGNDAHDLIGKLVLDVGDESVHNLVLLDGDGEGVNFLEGLDSAGLDKSSELGQWSPLVLAEAWAAAWSAATSASTAASATAVASSEASTASSLALWSWGWGWVSAFHFGCCVFPFEK